MYYNFLLLSEMTTVQEEISNSVSSNNPVEFISWVAGILALIITLIGLARKLWKKFKKLNASNNDLSTQIIQLKEQNECLTQDLVNAQTAGNTALTVKRNIDDLLARIMKKCGALSGSVYVKNKNDDLGLVFLSILPQNDNTSRIRGKNIPFSSVAGTCFKTQKSFISPNIKQDKNHYTGADALSGYSTENVLSYPVVDNHTTIAVVQLLNKKGNFVDNDIVMVETYDAELRKNILEFISDENNYIILNHLRKSNSITSIIMFCDITQSRMLFQEFNTSHAIDMINGYLETVCGIVISHDGYIENYVGDGMLFRFPVTTDIDDSLINALDAAFEIESIFIKAKNDWSRAGTLLNSIYSRITITYGFIYQSLVGHKQFKTRTIAGEPVNLSIILNQELPKTTNLIVVDEEIQKYIGQNYYINEIDSSLLVKSKSYTKKAYKITKSER